MATLIKFPDGSSFTIDATTTRNPTTTVEVTEHPIETGASVTDHQIIRPFDLKLDGTLVDFPLKDTANEGAVGRAARLFDRMEAAQLGGELLTVVTPDKQWERLKIVTLSAPVRRKGTINFSASLKQVQVVETQTVAVKRTNLAKGKGKTNGGRQTGRDATPAEKRKSLAAKLNDKAFDAVSNMILGK
jgi:hypothetical protein